MDYKGKICPYCKTGFEPEDDIVVCSNCEMPHHKNCWVENQGCTTFGCSGTIQGSGQTFENQSFTQNAGGVVCCVNCGESGSEANVFCPYCGTRLRKSAPEPRQYQYQATQGSGYQQPYGPSGYREEYSQTDSQNGGSEGGFSQEAEDNRKTADFVGNNSAYYLEKFHKMQLKKTRCSWNWCAFFVPAYWCVYRKMYNLGLILIAIQLLTLLMGIPGSFIDLAVVVIMGILGNSFYMDYVKRELSTTYGMGDYKKQQHLRSKGGTSSGAVIAAIVIFIVVDIVIQVTRGI